MFDKTTLIISLAVSFVAGTFFSVLLWYALLNQITPLAEQRIIIDPKELPVSIETFQNPVITQWIAGVEGTLVKKDVSSFTLEKNGQQLTIGVHPGLTGFLGEASPSSKTLPQYHLEQIPLGSYLRGAVTLSPQKGKGLKNLAGSAISGNAFTIVKTNK